MAKPTLPLPGTIGNSHGHDLGEMGRREFALFGFKRRDFRAPRPCAAW
jgi:hypothetical protein